jgi:hypothetical protein
MAIGVRLLTSAINHRHLRRVQCRCDKTPVVISAEREYSTNRGSTLLLMARLNSASMQPTIRADAVATGVELFLVVGAMVDG